MNKHSACFASLLAFVVALTAAQGQTSPYRFLAPMPGASFVPPETGIIIRPGGGLLRSSEEIVSMIAVAGDVSGRHSGKVTIADDGETAIFAPEKPFALGERVTVRLSGELGRRPEAFEYQFRISSDQSRKISALSAADRMASELLPADGDARSIVDVEKVDLSSLESSSVSSSESADDPSLPSDFPQIDVLTNDNPGDGYFFLAPISFASPGLQPRTPYLLILNNDGKPVFFRRQQFPCYDFKVQRNGHLTYFDSHPLAQLYFELDSTYTTVNYWSMGNGYQTDIHGMQLLPNGHALLMSYDRQIVDMSQYVAGGQPNATVTGYVIQEQDAAHNVVFEWRSWDHFQFTDAASDINLTASTVDYVHGNAIEPDSDGNILISCRHMDEITKINRQTGEIMWRWGGENNQFTFVNDTVGFSHQHDVRRLPNGHITLFDNGNGHVPSRSRGVEYILDEVNKTATQVWEYPDESERYSSAMGNVQRLPNGNTVIGWGLATQGKRKIATTEVHPDGSVAFELLTDTNVVTYRAFRFPWNGKSSVPYIWTEDADRTTADSLTVNLNMFGRGDIQEYTVFQGDGPWPIPSKVVGTTTDNHVVVHGLERGKTYWFQAVGKTAAGKETERSDNLLFTTLPIGPIIQTQAATLVVDTAGIGLSVETGFSALLSNIGENALTFSEIKITGDDAGDFEVISAGNLHAPLAPGESRDIAIRFTPSREGREAATLVIKSDAVNSDVINIPLQGVGLSGKLSGVDIDFGNVAVGVAKDTLVTEALCNTSQVPLVIASLSLDESAFSIAEIPALPLELAPGNCLEFTLRFAPTELRPYSGVLRVESNGKPSPLEIRLNGNADGIGNVATTGEGRVRSLTAIPNPAVNGVRIELELTQPSETRVDIVNDRGKTVRSYPAGLIEAGRHQFYWDGRNDAGRSCASGQYFIHVAAEGYSLSLPVTLIR